MSQNEAIHTLFPLVWNQFLKEKELNDRIVVVISPNRVNRSRSNEDDEDDEDDVPKHEYKGQRGGRNRGRGESNKVSGKRGSGVNGQGRANNQLV